MSENNKGWKQLGKRPRTLAVRLSEEMHDEVFAAAGAEGLSASDWARLLIKRSLEERRREAR